jgi:chemotaxis methyl-accepting protein methylase
MSILKTTTKPENKRSLTDLTKNFALKSKLFYSKPENSNFYYEKIKTFVSSKIDMDISNYRDRYLKRRLYTYIHNLDGVDSHQGFLNHLMANPDTEPERFKLMIAIHVTEFFRDIKPFKYIEQVLLPEISQQIGNRKKPIRILSAPCSTGQEPYSFAIIADYLKQKKIIPNSVEVIGTDIDFESIQTAQKGVYKIEALRKISDTSIKRNFDILDDTNAEIKPRIKNYCSFHVDNLLKMTSYRQKFDLIACRNFLIYIGKKKQKNVIDLLIKNLKPNGFLMFGKSEGMPMTPGSVLSPINLKEHIYQYKKNK